MTKPTSTPAAPPGGDHRQGPRSLSGPAAGSWDADAFAARFQDSARVLWTVAAGVLGNRSQVDDVLQEAAVIGLQKLDQFRPDSNFTAWMARIVRFVALNQARTWSRRRTFASDPVALDQEPRLAGDGDGAAPPSVDARGELGADDGSFDDELSGALADLKPVARACLLLRTLLDLDYREIARTLEIPEGTAMSHVHRARLQLRGRLAHRATPSPNPAVPTTGVAARAKGMP